MATATAQRPTFTTASERKALLDSLRVPEDLKTAPGNPTIPEQERYFSYAFPEVLHFRTPVYEFYDAYMARFSRDQEHSRVAKEKYGAELEELRRVLWTYHRKPASRRRDPSPDLTEEFRARAKELGFEAIGITAFDRMHVYGESRRKVKYKNLVILGMSQDWEDVQTTPSIRSFLSNFPPTVGAYHQAIKFADWVRSQGYPVMFIQASQGGIQLARAPILPYVVSAGLGQMGANGQVLTPLAGSRTRWVAFSTDAPLAHDQPHDYGINKLCEKCQVCVRRCPGRALPKTKVWWRGVLKYKTISDRCQPILARYEGCSLCIKVCPVQRYGLKAVLDYYNATGGKILGKGTEELEEYTLRDKGHFGPGQLPRFTVKEGGKGMIAMAKALGIKEGLKRKRLGHIPGLGREAAVAGAGRTDI